MEKDEAAAPPWVGLLLGKKFFDICDDHKELRRSEVNLFCIDCGDSLCSHCFSSPGSPHRHRHDGHRFLQIRRYVYQDVVRVHDMQKYVDCSKVQNFIVNGARVVLLNPKRQAKPTTPGRGAAPLCGICRKAIPVPNRYCSIACKVGDNATDPRSLPLPVSDPVDVRQGSDQDGAGKVPPPPATDAGEESTSMDATSRQLAPSSPPGSIGARPDTQQAPPKRRRKGVPRRARLF